ncbi:hypothetical protein [Brachybacterium sp. NPDC056505]|uniref:hypothetical protein n=1 Tax=Brachybacterium sp. NPDC056505 TaxID=3345843 RepID=UPI0036707173
MADLVWAAYGDWPRTLSSAQEVEVVVAVKKKCAVGAWSVLDAFRTDSTYTTPGGERPRIAFAFGEAIPLEPALHEVPREFRRGCAIAERA